MESVKTAAEIYMNYNFQFSHITYTEETNIYLHRKRVEVTDIDTHPRTFPTVRILHIPIMLHKLLAFYKDHIWGISPLINKEKHGNGKALNTMQ